MRVIFDGLAKIELDDGKEYYEMEVIGLGKRFKQEVKRAVNIIKKIMVYYGSPQWNLIPRKHFILIKKSLRYSN